MLPDHLDSNIQSKPYLDSYSVFWLYFCICKHPDIKQHWPIETYLVQDVLSDYHFNKKILNF